MPQLTAEDVAAYGPLCQRIVRQTAPPGADRQELAAFARQWLLSRLDRKPDDVHPTTYLSNVTKWATLRAAARERRRVRRLVYPDGDTEGRGWGAFHDDHPDPAAVVERRDLLARLRAVLATLPAADQELAASIGGHVPMHVTAAEYHVTPEAVRQRRQRLLRRLRAALD